MDAEEQRRRSREQWDSAAAGWERRERWMRETSRPVSAWLIDAVALQPGHRVLELAAGTGEVGLMAAELILPGGRLISSDRSGPMLTVARARAAELGLRNVDFKLLDGEAIDLPLASVDAVICRWGYMLMADPAAGLRETRRVLRPGGRLALAVWDAIDANPWARIPSAALVAHGLLDAPDPGEPGPFALADPDRVRDLLDEAGFVDVSVGAVDLLRPDPDFEAWWAGHLELSTAARRAVAGADPRQVADARAQMVDELRPFTQSDGSLLVPARTIVAAADA
jgi:ubiquinone/menaquinone biosynthesis C-methylase UbiE